MAEVSLKQTKNEMLADILAERIKAKGFFQTMRECYADPEFVKRYQDWLKKQKPVTNS